VYLSLLIHPPYPVVPLVALLDMGLTTSKKLSLIQYKDTLDLCHSCSLTGHHHACPFRDLSHLEPNFLPDFNYQNLLPI